MSDARPATAARPRAARPRSWGRWALGIVLAAAALFGLCHAFLLTVFVVEGVSMEPALHSGERLIVLRPLGEVERGDVLVFHNPIAPEEVLVKRVLALPGEEIEAADGCLFAGGFQLADPHLKPGTATGRLPPTRVGLDQFFVLGDNRNQSVDSRRLGPIPRRLVIGKVMWTLPR